MKSDRVCFNCSLTLYLDNKNECIIGTANEGTIVARYRCIITIVLGNHIGQIRCLASDPQDGCFAYIGFAVT
jgi:hypothetical protein